MMEGNEPLSTLCLMQPEVLSEDVLREILSQRLASAELADTPKYALEDLWHRLVTPQPQRTYADTRSGRWFSGRQRQTRRPAGNDREWTGFSQTPAADSGRISAAPRVSVPDVPTAASPSVSRLKPPPAVVLGQKRIIRLGSKRPPDVGQDRLMVKRRPSGAEPADKAAEADPPEVAAGQSLATGYSAKVADEPHNRTVFGKNRQNSSGDESSDIKAKLRLEKRKIKIRRKTLTEPEAKRTHCD